MYIEGLDSKYTDTGLYVIAYIDMLGVKAKIEKDIQDALGDIWFVNHFLLKEQAKNKDLIIKSFSDNFLIAIRTSSDKLPEDFSSIGNVVGSLCSFCLRMHKILLRGSIVIGNLHIDENAVLGKGLVKAYKFEDEIAIFPRIIIDNDLLKYTTSDQTHRDLKNPLFCDFDSRWCLNILHFCDERMEVAFRDKLKSNLAHQLYEAKDERVVSKINWLVQYVRSYYQQNYGITLMNLS